MGGWDTLAVIATFETITMHNVWYLVLETAFNSRMLATPMCVGNSLPIFDIAAFLGIKDFDKSAP